MKIKLRIKNSSKDIDFGDFEGEVIVITENGGRVEEGIVYDATFERYEFCRGCYKLRILITEKKNDKNS